LAGTGRDAGSVGLTALVGVGYFFVWTVFGMAAFPLGIALATVEMAVSRRISRASLPIVISAVVSDRRLPPAQPAWKASHLGLVPGRHARARASLSADAGTAWRQRPAPRLPLAATACVGLMAILLVIGVMDLRAMAVVAAAITVERHRAGPVSAVARATGAVVVGQGVSDRREQPASDDAFASCT